MKTMSLPVSLVVFLVASTAQANLCGSQATVLLERAAAEVTPGLSSEQLQQLKNISLELCQSRSAAQGETADLPAGFDDWFSYFMLTKQPDKAGNKRLKRLKK